MDADVYKKTFFLIPLDEPSYRWHHHSSFRAVKSDADAFGNGAKQFDDLIMLCVEFKGSVMP